MPVKPLISKIRCPSPNKRGTIKRNINYVEYIATREGVDLTDIEGTRELEQDIKSHYESGNDTYVKYIAERPNSNGLFGNIDTSDLKAVSRHLGDLSKEGRNIYRGIVSLSEEDALNLGYDQKQKWADYMRSVIPDVAKEFGIEISKLQWTAAVHMEKGHPHCHYMFWSTEDKISSPYIHKSKQSRIREFLSKEMFKEERALLVAEKEAKRELITQFGKRMLKEELQQLLTEKESSTASILGKVRKEHLEDFGKQLSRIADKLPESGRLDYKLLPPEAKEKVDDMVAKVLELPAMKKEYAAYLKAVENISKTYSPSDRHHKYNIDKADKDIRKRMANIILKSSKEVLRDKDFWSRYSDSAFEEKGSDRTMEPEAEEKGMEASEAENSDRIADKEFQYEYSKRYKEALEHIYNPEKRDIQKAVEMLEKEALGKNVLACMELGKLYERGLPETGKDMEKSHAYYKKAFDGLNQLNSRLVAFEEWEKRRKSNYEYKIGKMYENGQGTEQDYKKAMEFYEKSAVRNEYAAFSLGNMYLREKGIKYTEENRKKMIKTGLHYMKIAADKGFPYAAYTYAKKHETEPFLKENTSETVAVQNEYYSKAFKGFEKMLKEREDDFLLYRLGTMHYEGQGTEKSQKEALKYFQRSAELNNANAQYALGKTYSDKESGYYDLKKAVENLQKAAEQNLDHAKIALAKIYMNAEESFYDMKKAKDLYEQAAAHDNETAFYQLGKLHSNQEQGFYDLDKAIEYFEQAAGKGNEYAQYALGKIYLDEPQVSDIKKGMGYLEKASEQGNAYAKIKLGVVYLYGRYHGIEKNEELGMKYLKEAEGEGNEAATEIMKNYEDMQKNRLNSVAYQCLRGMFQALSDGRQNHETFSSLRKFKTKSAEQRRIDARKNDKVEEEFLPE
ncbi:MAG: relaxase MobL [Roseburia sp.]|nr:relaxase MobL [Roseburia sp.]MCM1277947.1 relaxase MobL [Robinsoniella sp.]